VCAVVLAAPGATAADLPPDLAVVPADAAVFLHFRFGDAWRSEHMKDFRELIMRAGPKAVEAISKRFTPDPMSFDRLTVCLLPPAADGPPEPQPILIFRMSKPFDPAALVKTIAPSGVEANISGARFIRDEQKDVALRLVDNQTFLVCPPKIALRATVMSKADGPLTPALARAAAGSHVLVAAGNAAAIPPQAFAQVPPMFAPLAQAKLATVTVELAAEPKVELRLRYADDKSAGAAELTARGLAQMALIGLATFRADIDRRVTGTGQPGTLEELPEALSSLIALGAINQVEQLLKDLPLRRDGAELSLAVVLPRTLLPSFGASNAVMIGLLLPAVQKVRDAAGRAKGQNNLKQIALAMHNYHDANGRLPAHAIYAKDGKTPLLSWRVAILPYIEQDNLYKQFKLDEPWDSEHNKKLIPLIPQVYVSPAVLHGGEPGLAHYKVFVGPAAGFDRSPRGRRLVDITDGTSNTLLAVETNDPVVWTKPDDIPFDLEKPLPKLTPIHPGGVSAAFFDGSVRFLSTAIDEKILWALITYAGGEVIPFP
jgi:prepilin-type processing-associated H-X9-DG protein